MMIKVILPLGLLGVLLVGCGGGTSQESGESSVQVLEELKESKMYKENSSADWDKISKAINATQGEK